MSQIIYLEILLIFRHTTIITPKRCYSYHQMHLQIFLYVTTPRLIFKQLVTFLYFQFLKLWQQPLPTRIEKLVNV